MPPATDLPPSCMMISKFCLVLFSYFSSPNFLFRFLYVLDTLLCQILSVVIVLGKGRFTFVVVLKWRCGTGNAAYQCGLQKFKNTGTLNGRLTGVSIWVSTVTAYLQWPGKMDIMLQLTIRAFYTLE
jgi:hypothetical protein